MNINDYTYILPADRIALYPLARRDNAKLLVYKEKQISHSIFLSLPEHLPANAFLFFNDTRVIPARLHFRKASGAVIEIFLLNPVQPSVLMAETMTAKKTCTWECTIGNLKKWTAGTVLEKEVRNTTLEATLVNRQAGVVQFTWGDDLSFAEILHDAGVTPLPPYIKRAPDEGDKDRYQTIYSRAEGAVAAPTAGLHFTPEVFRKLAEKNISHDFVTLHVSAGTFQPVKVQDPTDHIMHEEQIIISRRNVRNLLVPNRFITAVGTTSMRTLESLYCFGAKLLKDPEAAFSIGQRDTYVLPAPGLGEALNAVLQYMERNELETLVGETAIMIMPGYSFKVCKALITNFHQPASTLMLLVAAFVGEDWRKIYDAALKNDYRFLSYGDSSLLIP